MWRENKMRLEDYIHVVLEDIEEYKHLGMDQQGKVCVNIAKEIREDYNFPILIMKSGISLKERIKRCL